MEGGVRFLLVTQNLCAMLLHSLLLNLGFEAFDLLVTGAVLMQILCGEIFVLMISIKRMTFPISDSKM